MVAVFGCSSGPERTNRSLRADAGGPPAPESGGAEASEVGLPIGGTLVFQEFDDSPLGFEYFGAVEYDLPSGPLRRVVDGMYARRHPSGKTVYRRACGDRVGEIALLDEAGRIEVLTPCSSSHANPHSTVLPTDFEFANLSPDERWLAVERRQPAGATSYYDTLVFDREQTLVATFVGTYAPAWTGDGRLLVAGDGLLLTDQELGNLTRVDGGLLAGVVNNPAVHPDGTRVAFEYTQQIWQMNLDGTGLERIVSIGVETRFPAWSPDGRFVAYLGMSRGLFENRLYFTEAESGRNGSLNMDPVFGYFLSNPGGPLTWVP